MTGPEETARRVFGRRAACYTTSGCHTDPSVLARVVELAAPRPDWMALDVATGTGHTAFALAPHVAFLAAADLTAEMLAEARALRTRHAARNVSLLAADAHALPFDDHSFHLVTCRRAAHHFSDIESALAEARRVLRPGGRLVIDDRSVPEDDFIDAWMNRLDRIHDPSHVREYRPGEWRRMLEAAGFAVEAVEPYTRHRPLSSLTADVDPEGVRTIETAIDALDDAQRKALNIARVEGKLFLNHWYVMIAARRRE